MKRRYILVLMIGLLLISVLSCDASYEFNEEKMVTLGGETVMLQERDDAVYSKDFGFGFVIPDLMLDMVKSGTLEIFPLSTSVTMLIAYSDGIFDLITAFDAGNSTEQEQQAIREQVGKYVFQAAAVARAGIDVDQEIAVAEIEMSYTNVKKIAETEQDVYYYAYNDNFSHLVLAQGEEEKFEIFLKDLKKFEDNIFVFNPVNEEITQEIPNTE